MIKQQSFVLPLLFVLYEIATYLSNDMYLPALPQMIHDLQLSPHQGQLTLTTWFLGAASLPLLAGILSDRYGRRSILLLGGMIYIFSSAACAMITDVHLFLLARFIEGSVLCSATVPSYAVIHELYEQKQAIKILALMGSIAVLAPAFGPLLGGIVLYFTSWRGIFWIIVIWSVIAIALLAKWMPKSVSTLSEVHLCQLFHHYYRILGNKTFVVHTITVGFTLGGFIAWITAGPLLLMEHFHYTPIAFGFIQTLVFGANIIAAQAVKYLINRLGVKRLIRWGLTLTFIGGFLGLVGAHLFPLYLPGFLATMAMYSFGSGLNYAALNRLAIEACAEPMGMRVAMFSVFLIVFATLGSAIVSLYFDGSILSLATIIAGAVSIACLTQIWQTGLFFRIKK
jgi:Bcr/CflA subfamily drug resistance transporter